MLLIQIFLVGCALANLSINPLLVGSRDFQFSDTSSYSVTLPLPISTQEYTTWLYLKFTGTEQRNFYAMKLRALPQSFDDSVPGGMNNMLTMYYSQANNLNNFWISISNGNGDGDRQIKILNGVIFVPNRWTLIGLTLHYGLSTGKVMIRVFDNFPVVGSDSLTLSFPAFTLRPTLFANIGNSEDNPGLGWTGTISNVAIVNKYLDTVENIYLLSSNSLVDPYFGVLMNIPFFSTQNTTLRTNGYYSNTITYSGNFPSKLDRVQGIMFSSNLTATIPSSSLTADNTTAVQNIMFFMQFSYIEPISEEMGIFENGALYSPGTIRISLVEADKEVGKQFVSNVNLTDTNSIAVTKYNYNPSLNKPKRLKMIMWSINNKELTFLSPNVINPNTNQVIRLGISFHSDHIINIYYNDNVSSFLSSDISFFQYLMTRSDFRIMNNTSPYFTGQFNLTKFIITDRIPLAMITNIANPTTENKNQYNNINPRCTEFTSLVNNYTGCAYCAAGYVDQLNNCTTYCDRPFENFWGTCYWCTIPGCTNLEPGRFIVTPKNETAYSAILNKNPIFLANGTLWTPSLNSNFCNIYFPGLNASDYQVVKDVFYNEYRCDFMINPFRSVQNQELRIDWTVPYDTNAVYSAEQNLIQPYNTSFFIPNSGFSDPAGQSAGNGLSITSIVFFFIGLAAAAFCLIMNGHPYLKWRIMYSIHYVHFLALLILVNTDLPAITQSFNFNLYRVYIAKFNGVFNGTMIDRYPGNIDFLQNLNIPTYPQFLSISVVSHFLYNFLFVMFWQGIILLIYILFKIVAIFARGNKGPYRYEPSDTLGAILNAFEIDILYYMFAWFFVEFVYFGFLNFRYNSTAYASFTVSLIFAIVYIIIGILLLLFLAWVPFRSYQELDNFDFKRTYGCVYVNYVITEIKKHWEFLYFLKTAALMAVLAFAFPSPQTQGALLFTIWGVFFILSLVIKPWKNIIMRVIEAISDFFMFMVLLGYLLLLVNDSTNVNNYSHRQSVGRMIVAFAFLGIMFNFFSIITWCLASMFCFPRLFSLNANQAVYPLVFSQPEYNFMFKNGIQPLATAPLLQQANVVSTVPYSQIAVPQTPSYMVGTPAYMTPPPPPLAIMPTPANPVPVFTTNNNNSGSGYRPQPPPVVNSRLTEIRQQNISPAVSTNFMGPPPIPTATISPGESAYNDLAAKISASKQNFYARKSGTLSPARSVLSPAPGNPSRAAFDGFGAPAGANQGMGADEGDRSYSYSVFMKEK